MIYIDPPYNTGHDFVYNDNFKNSIENYKEITSQKSRANPETSGRFHTDWLNMMYSRLILARNLLTDDGVIFISIDDNESHNLKKICDEIFGEHNFIVEMVNITGASQNGDGVLIQKNFESCLVYSKNIDVVKINRIDKADESLRNLNDAPTDFLSRPDMGYTIYFNEKTNDIIAKKDYIKDKIYLNEEKLVYINDEKLIKEGYVPIRPGKKNGNLHRWRWGIETFNERKGEIVITKSKDKFNVFFKQKGYNPPKNILNYTVGTTELKKIFDEKKYFDFPKNTKMLKYLLAIGSNDEDIVMDFFSGSSTTADALLQLNGEQNSRRKFIMVQLPEFLQNDSEAYVDGYTNICEIAEERIRRAGKKIYDELKEKYDNAGMLVNDCVNPDNLDFGFKVFKLDSTNIKPWDGTIKLDEHQLKYLEDTIKEGRKDLDVVYEIMLKYGIFNMPLKEIIINNKTMYSIGEGYMIICLDDQITSDDVDEIGKLKPHCVVFNEKCIGDNNLKLNCILNLKRMGVEDIKCI